MELPNDRALITRCIVIPMHETDRTDLNRITDVCIQSAAHSRNRDLYEALAFPIADDKKLQANPTRSREHIDVFRDQQEAHEQRLVARVRPGTAAECTCSDQEIWNGVQRGCNFRELGRWPHLRRLQHLQGATPDQEMREISK
jgi:hypothetical protein